MNIYDLNCRMSPKCLTPTTVYILYQGFPPKICEHLKQSVLTTGVAKVRAAGAHHHGVAEMKNFCISRRFLARGGSENPLSVWRAQKKSGTQRE